MAGLACRVQCTSETGRKRTPWPGGLHSEEGSFEVSAAATHTFICEAPGTAQTHRAQRESTGGSGVPGRLLPAQAPSLPCPRRSSGVGGPPFSLLLPGWGTRLTPRASHIQLINSQGEPHGAQETQQSQATPAPRQHGVCPPLSLLVHTAWRLGPGPLLTTPRPHRADAAQASGQHSSYGWGMVTSGPQLTDKGQRQPLSAQSQAGGEQPQHREGTAAPQA